MKALLGTFNKEKALALAWAFSNSKGRSCLASGWQPWPDTDSCYRLQEDPRGLTWLQARALCQQEPGGDLVSITSHLENQREFIFFSVANELILIL